MIRGPLTRGIGGTSVACFWPHSFGLVVPDLDAAGIVAFDAPMSAKRRYALNIPTKHTEPSTSESRSQEAK